MDRDGVLNEYLPNAYVTSPTVLRVLQGVSGAIKALNQKNIPVFIISNQQGVGKGIMNEVDLKRVDDHLKSALMKESGASITESYYCCALSSENSPLRKPAPGMLMLASQNHNVDLGRSVLIGDSPTDIAAGIAAGVRSTVLVLTGATRPDSAEHCLPKPTCVCNSMLDAVDMILRGEI